MNGALRPSSDQPIVIFGIHLGLLLAGVLESVKLQFLGQYAAEIGADLQKRRRRETVRKDGVQQLP